MLSLGNNNTCFAFSCSTCHATFDDNEAQRAHYKQDWHKYNLKRKIAGLPTITELEFIELNRNEKPKNIFSCDICNKTFHNENTLKDHEFSKKHIDNVANYEKNKLNKNYISTDDESGDDLSDDDKQYNDNASKEPKINWKKRFAEAKTDEEFNKILDEKIKTSKKIEENECLFCNFKGQSFEEKMKHMIDEHTFYVPDIEYVSDLKGLMKYLADKISIGNTCIYCHKMFHSLEAIRKHMFDKGHTKISYEEGPDLEIAAFYDFSSLSDSSNENQENEEIENNSKALTITSEGTELILPSGAHIGHRDYKRYYNQNLRDYHGSNSRALMPLSEKYKVLGYYEIGSSGMTIEKERLEKMKETRKQLKKYGKERQSMGEKTNDFFKAWGRLGFFKKVFLQ